MYFTHQRFLLQITKRTSQLMVPPPIPSRDPCLRSSKGHTSHGKLVETLDSQVRSKCYKAMKRQHREVDRMIRYTCMVLSLGRN